MIENVVCPGYYNMDCMQGMRNFPDKYFDLAIVDPPYGGGANSDDSDINIISGGEGQIGKTQEPDALIPLKAGYLKNIISASSIKVHRVGGAWDKRHRSRTGGVFSRNDIRHWDVAPQPEYFKELARVSKNQIIWGGNYFGLPATRCFLVWDKINIPESFSMAMCEYAWTSFNDNAKIFRYIPQGTKNYVRFHPTQKPVALYQWILNCYAKPGDKILDTHVGSASSLVAFHNAGYEYVGFETDEFYYKKSKQRLDAAKAQVSIYDFLQNDFT